MSFTLQRLLSLRHFKIRGYINAGSKALILNGFGNDGFPGFHSGKYDIQVNSCGLHTGNSEDIPSIDLAAIFNSTKLNIVDRPLVREHFIIDPAIISNLDISDKPKNEKVIEEPEQPSDIEKRTLPESMLRIRRRKMKKHKLKKLRKRMKFEWKRKALLRRKVREKEFISELVAKVHTAEGFSPERVAAEQRRIIKQTYLPLKYEEMPQWYFKEVMDKQKRLEREEKEDQERNKLLEEFNKTYKTKGGLS